MENIETIVISGEEAAKISKVIKEIKEEITLDALNVIEKYEKSKENRIKQSEEKRYENVLHNTKLLMQNYRNFKQHISTVTDLEEEIMENWIIDWDNDKKVINEILKTRARTETMLKHIDNCLSYYEAKCMASNRDDVKRKYQVIKMLYLDDKKMSHFEIAKELRGYKQKNGRTC